MWTLYRVSPSRATAKSVKPIKSYREIRQAIATSFTEVFGASINLEPSSPDGMFVDLLAYMYTELAQVIQTVGANIDVSTATGTFLDMLASIAGLARNEGETDESLRQRIETATFDGLATPDGMTTYLKENITDGITFKENTKNETVGGIPAHSFVLELQARRHTELRQQQRRSSRRKRLPSRGPVQLHPGRFLPGSHRLYSL